MPDPDQNDSPPPRPLWLSAAVLAALNTVLYLPALDNAFSLDDFNWLARAEFAPSWWRFVFDLEPGQILNPVPRVLLLLVSTATGNDPCAIHLAILALHILAVVLLLVVVDRISGSWSIALLAAVLFSLQTSYDEAIFWAAAFFHPLTGVLVLGALIAAERYLAIGGRTSAVITALFSLAGLLTKASCFVVAPVIVLLPGPRKRRTVLAGTLASLTVAVAIANVAAGAAESYLISEGHYRPGGHLVLNLLHYLGWMVLPFNQVVGWVGLNVPWSVVWTMLGAVVLLTLVMTALRTPGWTRPFIFLLLAPLALVLPFAFDPVSRYTYLPALGGAALGAWLVVRMTGRTARSRWLRASLLTLIAATSLADTRLRDNHYEHHEQRMATWIRDVVEALPAPPQGGTIWIIDLPRLAIDPGIHLEAALRLAFNDPELRLMVVSEGDSPPGRGPVLRHVAGRIVAEKTDGDAASTRQVPRNHVPDVEQVDPEQGESSGPGGERQPSAGELPEAEPDKHGAGRGQHQEVPALGLEVKPAVHHQGDQQHEMCDDGPRNDPFRTVELALGTAPPHEPDSQASDHSRRQRHVNDHGSGVGQHLHPAEGAPPALKAAKEKHGDPMLAKHLELGSWLVESERARIHGQRIQPAIQRDVPYHPRKGEEEAEPCRLGDRTQPAVAGTHEPQPRRVQRDRDHGSDLDQYSNTDQQTDPRRARLFRHRQQQQGPHKLDGRIVADRHRHGAPHGVERDQPCSGRGEPAIAGEHRSHDPCRENDHEARHQKVEQSDSDNRTDQLEDHRRDQVVERRLVGLVGDVRHAAVVRADPLEVISLQLLELSRSPRITFHHRQTMFLDELEKIVEVGRLVRPVEGRDRGHVPDGDGRVNQNRGWKPRSPRQPRSRFERMMHET
jgi:hypothetical protein